MSDKSDMPDSKAEGKEVVRLEGAEVAIVERTELKKMNAIRHKPMLRKAVATGLFIFGIAAIALPLIPGWVLIGAALYLFSIDSPELQGHIHRYRNRFSHLDTVLKHSYDRLHQKRQDD